jgi:hypothetical protein
MMGAGSLEPPTRHRTVHVRNGESVSFLTRA